MISDISAFSTTVDLDIRVLQCPREPRLIQTLNGARYVCGVVVMDRNKTKVDITFWADTLAEAKNKIAAVPMSSLAKISGLRVATVPSARARFYVHEAYHLQSTPTTRILPLNDDSFPNEPLTLMGFTELMAGGEGSLAAVITHVQALTTIHKTDGSVTKKSGITIASPSATYVIKVDLWADMADWVTEGAAVGQIVGLRDLRWNAHNAVATTSGDPSRVVIQPGDIPVPIMTTLESWKKNNDPLRLPAYEPEPIRISWDDFNTKSVWPYNGMFALDGTIASIRTSGLILPVCNLCNKMATGTQDTFRCEHCTGEGQRKTIFKPIVTISGAYGLKPVFEATDGAGETLFGCRALEFQTAITRNARAQEENMRNLFGKTVNFVFYVRRNPSTQANKFYIKRLEMGLLPEMAQPSARTVFPTGTYVDNAAQKSLASTHGRSSRDVDIMQTLKKTLSLLATTDNKAACMILTRKLATFLENSETEVLAMPLETLEVVSSSVPQGQAATTLPNGMFELLVDSALAKSPQSDRLEVVLKIMNAWQQDIFQPYLEALLDKQVDISIPETVVTPRKLPAPINKVAQKSVPRDLMADFNSQSDTSVDQAQSITPRSSPKPRSSSPSRSVSTKSTTDSIDSPTRKKTKKVASPIATGTTNTPTSL